MSRFELVSVVLVFDTNCRRAAVAAPVRAPAPVVVAHGDAHGQAAPCSPVRAARRTIDKGPPRSHRWELLTAARQCPYIWGRRFAALIHCSLLVTVTRHHFENAADLAGAPAALVSTRWDGSPLVAAPAHTIQVALTPHAAAALLGTLEGQTLPAEVAALLVGLRGAAASALAEA